MIQLAPEDDYNRQLVAHVHPQDWVNPTPSGKYNLVVVGAGTAGLVTAAGAAGLGAKVALIERALMGGDCLNVGCVPSKAVIRCARAAAAVRQASGYGVHAGPPQVDFPAIMERMRRLRSGISHHDSASRFRDLGVDVYLGDAAFTGPDTVEVAGRKLKFSKGVIATGARAAELPIPGLADVAPLTNETVFNLTELPRRLAVIGGGPIGAELAQAFARFGSEVTLLEKSGQILSREDPDAAQVVQAALARDGVRLLLNSEVAQCEVSGGEKIIHIRQVGSSQTAAGPSVPLEKIAVDAVLIGLGRQPNVEGLGLEAAGVKYDLRSGVEVNDRLQTTNSRIYAAGDVCSKFKFTHAADFMARLVIRNALFFGRAKLSALTIPWCTYTSPELAHVGLTPQQAAAQGVAIDTFTQPLSGVDRAILEGETEGFVRIHVKRGKDQILGATIVAENAGDMIGSISVAITNGIGLGKIANSIHPYPTQAEAIRKAGDLYQRTRLTPTVKSLFEKWLAWSR